MKASLTKTKTKMDYQKFYKTTTKQELFDMVLELAGIADISGDTDRMIETTRDLIRDKIDSEDFFGIVNAE